MNRHLVDELVSVVTGNARGDLALDLYAGVGLFSAALAGSFHHIFAVEASQTSHGDLVQNVPANVKAVGARTEDYLRSDYLRSRPVRKRPDLVVLDPPRTGAGKAVIRSLVELGAPRCPICFVRSGDAGQGSRPPSGGRISHRGSTLIRSLPRDVSHRIGDAAGALTAFTSPSSSWKTGGLAEGPAQARHVRAPLVLCRSRP